MQRALEVLRTFFFLGLTAFGGPAAHIAIFQRLLVEERGWVNREDFRKLLGAVNLIPGPNSTEMTMLLGYTRAGGWGLMLGGLGFIVPAALVTLLLVALYRDFAEVSLVQGAFLGFRLAVLALIAQALMDLLPHPRQEPFTWIFALSALGLVALGLNEALVVLLVGLLALGARRARVLAAEPFTLFLFFLKVGAVLFGSGYVLVAFLQETVARGWLRPTELLDAVALGQITPGPLLTTATAVGYLASGVFGAALATVGIFLPSFIVSALLARFLERVAGNPVAEIFLKGAAGAALGLIAWALWLLGREVLTGWLEAALALLALVLLRRKVPVMLLLGISALGGAIWALA